MKKKRREYDDNDKNNRTLDCAYTQNRSCSLSLNRHHRYACRSTASDSPIQYAIFTSHSNA